MKTRVRALIVDDEAPAREELRYLLREIPGVEVVGEAAHAHEALELIRSLRYDVVFLDIRMSGPNGLELARTLQALRPRPQVVFVTAYGEYALGAFEVQAADYLVKPVDAERLQRAVDRVASGRLSPAAPPNAASRAGPGPNAAAPDALIRIPVPTAYKTLLVDPADVYYLKALEGGVRLVTKDGEMTIRSTLKDLQARLDPARFFRAHRNFIINLEKVAELVPDARGGLAMRLVGPRSEQIPLSRRQARRLRRLLDL
ncbi:MAG TPA: LytTR family DNA-binding domain-containing protein [Bacillota bacterium]